MWGVVDQVQLERGVKFPHPATLFHSKVTFFEIEKKGTVPNRGQSTKPFTVDKIVNGLIK